MIRIIKLFLHGIAILVLTIVTQIGGVIYLSVLVIKKNFKLSRLSALGVFLCAYLLTTLLILPLIAPIFGRTALPIAGNLRPLSFITCLLNRHYVDLQLREQMKMVSDQMNTKYDGTITNYLDANFPFYDGFPLFPHLSHNDGKKLDLAFYYKEQSLPSNSAPSFIGYGIYEAPKGKETDYPNKCRQNGYWQYGILSSVIPQWNKDDFQLDVERTRELIKLLAEDHRTSKIFIEPHLKQRWKLTNYRNIRFHGCQAVRHDDHIHTQIK